MENLHVYSSAFIFHRKPESCIRFFRIAQMEGLAYTLAKAVAVFKFAGWPKGSIQVNELSHPFFGEFPQHSLVGRATGNVDSTAPLGLATLTSFSSIHRLKHMICGKFDITLCDLIFFEHVGIGGHDSNDWRVTTPVEFSWETPIILKIDKKPSVAFGVLWPKYLGYNSVRSTDGYISLLVKLRSRDAGIERCLALSAAGIKRFLGLVSDSLFLCDHTLGSLPDFVGGLGHTSHFLGLGIGGDCEIVSVLGSAMNFVQLPPSENAIDDGSKHGDPRKPDNKFIVYRYSPPFLCQSSFLGWTVFLAGIVCCGCGCYGVILAVCLTYSCRLFVCGCLALICGAALCNGGICLLLYHKKYLTTYHLCNTFSDMANVLSTDKQTAIIAALAEGSSIRSIERITGVHRDTIMRLGVRVGKGCTMLMDSKMQDLDCNYLQFDELWGFIGKKERHCSVDDNPEYGDVWTFCAIDSETKLVPTFKCGKRTLETTTEFVQDVASRMRHRVQVSSDAMHSYIEAMERAFGADVDYGQCVKVYTHDAAQHPERKYSAPSFASAYRRPIAGTPEMELVSTSHVERLNATTRLHVKRLSRLTLAFSKKFENFQAAVGLHFAYYNFVKRHNTLRCTPAMAAGIERDFWSVGQLVEATA